MSKIEERLIDIRKSLNLSQEKFGREIGMTRSAIAKMECGENAITEKNIILICQTFGIGEEWFRYGTGQMRDTGETDLIDAVVGELGTIGKKDLEIVRAYLMLDEKYRAAFRLFLEGLTNKK